VCAPVCVLWDLRLQAFMLACVVAKRKTRSTQLDGNSTLAPN